MSVLGQLTVTWRDVYNLINMLMPLSKIGSSVIFNSIYINGNEEEKISFEFDVFERWDTILNRDASKYIINSNSKWRLEL